MHHSSDDEIIHLLNSGSVYFTKINNSDTKLPSFGKSGQIYVRVTFRTGDQECTRVLHLKGQVLGSDNKSLGTQKSKFSSESLISPVNETSPNEQIGQLEEVVPELANVQVPLSEELSEGHIQSKKRRRKTRNKGRAKVEISPVNETSPSEQIEQREEAVPEVAKVQVPSSEELSSGHIQSKKKRTRNKGGAKAEPTKCYLCNIAFSKHIEHLSHMREIHGVGLIPCKFCDKSFQDNKSFKEHKSMEHRVPDCLYASSMIDYNVPIEQAQRKLRFTISNFARKVPTVTPTEKGHHCRSCNLYFPQFGYLLIHTKTFHKEGHYKCITCNKILKSVRSFETHLSIKHKMSDDLYTSFTGDMPSKCKISSKSFFENQTLGSNINEHAKEVSLQCNKYPVDTNLGNHSHSRVSDEFKSLLLFSGVGTDSNIEIPDKFDSEYLIEPKIEVKDEGEDFWFTEPDVKIKEETDTWNFIL